METTPLSAKMQLNRPLVIAASVLGGVAALQIVAAAVVFAANARNAITTSRAQAVATEGVLTARVASLVSSEPLAAARPFRGNANLLEPQLPAAQSNPTPIRDARLKSSNTLLVNEQVQLALGFRDRGDIPSALVKLREADSMSPDNPQILGEMAYTYEKLTQNDKAIELWRRVKAMGERAGVLYDTADRRLRNGVGPEIPKAIYVAPPRPNRGLFGVEAAPVPGLDIPIDENDLPPLPGESGTTAMPVAAGQPPPKMIELSEVTVLEDVPGDAKKRMKLLATIQAKPKSIQRERVQIEVLFFDMVDNQFVTKTSADVMSQWRTIPADWAEDGVEILEVDYKLMKSPEVKGQKQEDRNYFGYIVRVYYDKQLQAVRGAPDRVMNDFPTSHTLASEDPLE